MASQGPVGGTYFEDDNTVGTFSWANVTNAGAADESYATTDVMSDAPDVSHYLTAVGFPFSIPSDSTVVGIQVDVMMHGDGDPGWLRENSVKIMQSRRISGNDLANDTKDLPVVANEYTTTGGPTELWGLSWNPSDVNSANSVGVALSYKVVSDSTQAYVDYITMTVYYTGGTPPAGGTIYKAVSTMRTLTGVGL